MSVTMGTNSIGTGCLLCFQAAQDLPGVCAPWPSRLVAMPNGKSPNSTGYLDTRPLLTGHHRCTSGALGNALIE